MSQYIASALLISKNTIVFLSTKESSHRGHDGASHRGHLVRMGGLGQKVLKHKPLLSVADTNHLLSIHIWVMPDNAE